MDHILFTHSFVDGCLGSFHLLAIVSNASVNMTMQISVWAKEKVSTGRGRESRKGMLAPWTWKQCVIFQLMYHWQKLVTVCIGYLLLNNKLPQTSWLKK